MRNGFSFESFAGLIEVTKETIYNWTRENPDFLDAKQKGFALCQLYYEKIGIMGMLGKIPNFNALTWRLNMSNRFGWNEKHKFELEDIKPTIINRLDGSKEILGLERKSIEADYKKLESGE